MTSQAQPDMPPVPPTGRRPRNRRELILAAASELFVRQGYPAVAMADIAGAVAVRPSALYRHFPGKQDLLHEVVAAAIRPGVRILAAAGDADLASTVAALADEAIDSRNLGVLWQRESHHLPTGSRNELRRQVRDAMYSLRASIRQARPDVDLHQAEFLASGVFAVLISVGYHDVELSRVEQVRLLRDMAMGLVSVPVPELSPMEDDLQPAQGLGSRREVLLALGMARFSTQGYEAVSVDDIASSAGIAGPSFYYYFTGKADLLWAGLSRANEAMRTEMTRALRRANGPVDALQRVMAAYIDLALDCPEVIEALLAYVAHLQAPERQRANELQLDLLGEWLTLVHRARPGVDRRVARCEVQAALTLVNDVALTRHLRDLVGVAEALRVATSRILLPNGSGEWEATNRVGSDH